MNSRSSGTTVIRRVATYVLDEHPDERLSELRKIAAEHNWEVTGEYVDRIKPDYQLADNSIEFQPGEAFRALQEADHANRHDAVLSSVGSGGPRLSVNQHGRVSGSVSICGTASVKTGGPPSVLRV